MNFTENDCFSCDPQLWVFVNRNCNLSFQERTFYIGSSKIIDERICHHVREIIDNTQNKKERNSYFKLG